MKKYDQIL